MAAFSDIIGQQRLKAHAQAALKTGNITHACLISGDAGMGKRMFARTWAQAIMCEDRRERNGVIEPCGECPSCVMAEAGTHPDIITLTHEKAAYSVDEIRTQLVADSALKPMRGERRIYIVPDADTMNVSCQNALLKTLEEPPAHVMIMLLARRPGALLGTISSRVVELPLRPVDREEITALLMKKYQIPDYRARECAELSDGNVGAALSYAGDDRFKNMLERTAALLKDLKRLMTGEMMTRLLAILLPATQDEEAEGVKKKRSFKEAGADEIERFLDLLTAFSRDALVYKAGVPEKLVFAGAEAYYKEAAQRSWRELYGQLGIIKEARDRLSANVGTELTLELLMLGLRDGVEPDTVRGREAGELRYRVRTDFVR